MEFVFKIFFKTSLTLISIFYFFFYITVSSYKLNTHVFVNFLIEISHARIR